ncbi:ATP-dependent DNA helicase Hel308 [uncultured archaeon]|nr:ATP-dependent DNA helicase Hel308 [uncultured archaeon]
MQIEFQEEKHSQEHIFGMLNPMLSQWFRARFGSFTEPQLYAIPNIHFRQNTLVSAETGTGKTFSAFTSILSELLNCSDSSTLEDRVYCVYISPLRALSNDIRRNLLEPLEEIMKKAEKDGKKIRIRVGVRTGDTTQSERSSMLRKAPHILITTPESLAIMLNAPKFRENFRQTEWVIVDEIHSLAENKRGVHLSLSLERLQRLSPNICRIGLSATISPLKEIAAFLVGCEGEKERDCKIVDVSFLKKMDLQVVSPLESFTNATTAQINKALYGTLNEMIQSHKTTLIFTNTRSATERVVHTLKDKFPTIYGEANIGTHHSSLSRELRLNVEERLKRGELKCVVCSTSLELGIDIGYIDLVVLLGSPKSIARAIQRIGRSGHQLHSTVKGRIIVLDRDDLVECSVMLKCALEKKIDKIRIPQNCLDVLSQHVYGIAIEDKIHVDELYRLVRQSYCFRGLSRFDFNEVVDYLSGGYSSLEVRHVYAKIWFDEKTGMIGRRGKNARLIYMTNIGTIPDEAKIKVKIGEQSVGTIDEGFLERLHKGDVFVLGGQTYEFKFARGMTAQVTAAYRRPPTVPSWFSEMLPLSFDLSIEIGKFRKLMEEKLRAGTGKKDIVDFLQGHLHINPEAANAVYEYFLEQYKYLEIPNNGKILIERFSEEGVTRLVFHSLYGRRTNDALSFAYSFALSKISHKDIEISMNDNGFMLSFTGQLPVEKALTAVNSKDLRKILEMAISNTELLGRRFRHCATRALMILRTYRGQTKSAGRQQMAARLLLSAVRRISNDFIILKEARREVLEDAMDIASAQKVIDGIGQKLIKVRQLNSGIPSPFAWNIAMQGRMDTMKMEDRLAFIKRMHGEIMQRIGERDKKAKAEKEDD